MKQASDSELPASRRWLRSSVVLFAAAMALPGAVVAYAGQASADQRIDVTVVLSLPDQAGLDSFAEAVSTPGNASYRHYLSASEFRDRFAPSALAADTVVAFLRGSGFSVDAIPNNRFYVRASGTVAQAEQAFQTRIDVRQVGASTLRVHQSAPVLPATVGRYVDGVAGLSTSVTFTPRHVLGVEREGPTPAYTTPNDQLPGPPNAFVNAPPCSTYWAEKIATQTPEVYGQNQPYAPCGYIPTQLRGAYAVDEAVHNGTDGHGVTVAIVDAFAAPTMLADANKYSVKHDEPRFSSGQFRQLNASTFINTAPPSASNPNGCGAQGWYGEETLDVEAVHAIAPGAKVLYAGAKDCSDLNLLDRLNVIIDHQLASVISNSWGSSGDFDLLDPATQKAYTHTFQQAVAQGISVLFSSGDNGDEVANTGARTVDFPASDPWVTAVGGTSLAVGKSNNHLFETGWGTSKAGLVNGNWSPAPPGTYLYGAGGGTSKVFNQPRYQRGVVPKSISGYFGGNGRAVPDIAMVGDPQTGMLIGETQFFPDKPNDPTSTTGTNQFGEYRIGGTSLSSPLFAGMLALADQIAGSSLGFANPAIYALSGSESLRDVVNPEDTVAVVRNNFLNSIDATGGISTSLRTMNTTATLHVLRGYDDVTGVGTPNGRSFLNNLAAGRNSG